MIFISSRPIDGVFVTYADIIMAMKGSIQGPSLCSYSNVNCLGC